MFKNLSVILDNLLDHIIYKTLKKRFKKYSQLYPNICGRVFDIIPLQIKLAGRFEINELETLKYCVFNKINSRTSTSLDIGANIGNHALFFSDYFSKVYAFEPVKINFELLKINCTYKNNIEALNFGASDLDEIKDIVSTFNIDPGHSKIVDNLEKFKNSKSEKIQTRNLDNFFQDNKVLNIKFIKIDVEGFEYRVLKGLTRIIKTQKPVIAIEQFPEEFEDNSTKSLNFLKEIGYKYFYEPNFLERKKSKNKIFSAFLKIYFTIKILFSLNIKKNYSLKEIKKFSVKPYPMILASFEDLS